jgi:non-heme dioxygenase-like protein
MTQMAELAVTSRAPAAMIGGTIPLIDVAGHLAGDAEASLRAAAELRWAFENVGFYYLAGHGVSQSLIDRTYDAATRFGHYRAITGISRSVRHWSGSWCCHFRDHTG